MSGRRSGVRWPALATAVGASVLYTLLVRPRLLMWGATADEVTHARARSRPQPLTRTLGLLVFEPVHFIMQARQFRNLHTRLAAPVTAPPSGG